MFMSKTMVRAIKGLVHTAVESYEQQALAEAYMFLPDFEPQEVMAKAVLPRHAKEYSAKKAHH